jgi:hypothetical protein
VAEAGAGAGALSRSGEGVAHQGELERLQGQMEWNALVVQRGGVEMGKGWKELNQGKVFD